MLPQVTDIAIWRGSTPPIAVVLSLKDPDTGAESPAVLTGATVLLEIRWSGGSIDKTSADGSLTVDAASGTVTWTPTRAETLSLPAGRLATYTFEIVSADGTRNAYLTGFLIGVQAGANLPPDPQSPLVIRVVQRGLQGPPGVPADVLAQTLVQALIFG